MLKRTLNLTYRPSISTARWVPTKWRHFQVTSGHFTSHEVISGHVTASSCGLQPCRCSKRTQNLTYRSSTATSRWFPAKWHHFRVTSGHVRSFPATWLTPHASYSPLGAQTYPKLDLQALYSHFQLTSGQMMSLPGHFRLLSVMWGHFVSRDWHLLRATAL